MPLVWHRSFKKGIAWGSYVAAHALVTVVLICVIAGIQRLLIWIGDPKLFDWVPLRYIFDVVDLGILAAFIFFGTREAVHVFREQDDD